MRLNVSRGFRTGTRIRSIDVPPQLRVKRTSGIGWLDEALGDEGGFTPTSTVMLTGGPGTGKSTLLRTLADTMTAAGHLVLYNTGEESLYQAKMSAERLGLKTDFLVGEEVMLPRLLQFMDNAMAEPKNKGKTPVFLQDSLQTLDDGRYVDKEGNSRGTTGKTPTHCALGLVDWAQKNFGVVVFVCQCTKGDVFKGDNTIKHAIDVHSHMFVDERPKSETYGSLLLEVSKNRWGPAGMRTLLELTRDGIACHGSLDMTAGRGRAALPRDSALATLPRKQASEDEDDEEGGESFDAAAE